MSFNLCTVVGSLSSHLLAARHLLEAELTNGRMIEGGGILKWGNSWKQGWRGNWLLMVDRNAYWSQKKPLVMIFRFLPGGPFKVFAWVGLVLFRIGSQNQLAFICLRFKVALPGYRPLSMKSWINKCRNIEMKPKDVLFQSSVGRSLITRAGRKTIRRRSWASGNPENAGIIWVFPHVDEEMISPDQWGKWLTEFDGVWRVIELEKQRRGEAVTWVENALQFGND